MNSVENIVIGQKKTLTRYNRSGINIQVIPNKYESW